MRKWIRVWITILGILIEFSGIVAQSAVLSSGNDATGEGGTVAYSVGQVAYSGFESETGTVSQGVQQTYLSIMVSTQAPEPFVQALLYPNPVDSELQLILDSKFSGDFLQFTYSLYDLSGREILHAVLQGMTTNIPMADKMEGVYFLKVCHQGKCISTFKVIKTN